MSESWWDYLRRQLAQDPIPAPAPAPEPVPAPAPILVPISEPTPILVSDPVTPPMAPAVQESAVLIEGFPCYLPVFEGAHPGWTGYPPSAWEFPDTANTSSTEDLWFSKGMRTITEAQFIVVWEPKTTWHYCRFVAMPMNPGDGYGTWSEICSIQGAADRFGWGPRSFRFNCTSYFQQARLNQKDLYIGFQVWGDGVTPMTVWKSRLLLWVT